MTSVSRERLIEHPPAAVWKVLADFATISTWAPNVEHSSAASERREGVGAVRRVQVGRMALLETVTEWAPDERLGYRIEGLPPAAGSVDTSWELIPQPGGTRVSVTTTISPAPGPPGRIVSRVLSRKLAGAATEMVDGLAHHLQEIP